MTTKQPHIDYVVTRATVCELIDISQTTLRQWQQWLNALKPKGWSYKPRQRGFDLSAIEVLRQWKILIELKHDRDYAGDQIIKVMERYYEH